MCLRYIVLMVGLWIGCAGSLLAQAFSQRDGYKVETIEVPLSHGQKGKGYLLTPDEEKRDGLLPAILLLHDHGAYFSIGKEKMVYPIARADLDSTCNKAIEEEAVRWTKKCYEGMFIGDSLARNGYVVLVIDALYWGERRVDTLPLPTLMNEKEGKQYNKRLKAQQEWYYKKHEKEYGCAWYETILADDRACVDYLCALPYVDKERIGVVGFSMGAYRAWQIAAADKRIKVCVASNWMTTKEDHLGKTKQPSSSDQSAYAMYRPSVAADYPEIAAAIAPRGMLLLYGEYDHLFAIDSIRTAIRRIEEGYRETNATQMFQAIAMPYGHFFSKAHWQTCLGYLKKEL